MFGWPSKSHGIGPRSRESLTNSTATRILEGHDSALITTGIQCIGNKQCRYAGNSANPRPIRSQIAKSHGVAAPSPYVKMTKRAMYAQCEAAGNGQPNDPSNNGHRYTPIPTETLGYRRLGYHGLLFFR